LNFDIFLKNKYIKFYNNITVYIISLIFRILIYSVSTLLFLISLRIFIESIEKLAIPLPLISSLILKSQVEISGFLYISWTKASINYSLVEGFVKPGGTGKLQEVNILRDPIIK